MNNFSSFQSQLFRGGVNLNSLSSLNKYSINITLDPSGTDYTQLLDNNSTPVKNAYLINASGSDTYLQVQTATSQNISVADFLPSNQSNVTLYTKYKYHNSAPTQSIFSHLFNGLFYDIDFSGTSVDNIYHLVYPGNSFDIRFLAAGSSVISYAISGMSEGVVTPESGFLSQVYEKKTVTLGNDASSGIITIDVGDISNAAVAYVPYVHVVRKGQPNIGEYVLTIDNQLQSAVSKEIGYHYFDVTDLAGEANSDYIAFSTVSSDAGYGNYSVNVDTSVGNYVRIMVNENTPDLYYTSPSFPGGTFFSPNSYDVLYVVKVVTNVAGQNVYAFDLSGDDVYYNQPDLSFVSGKKYKFDVSDPSNDGYTLSFATTVDTTPDETYVTRVSSDSAIFLDLYSYIGADPYVYFEQDVSGMGYNEMVESITVDQAEITAGNIDVSTVGGQSVITFKAPSATVNTTYDHSVTFPSNMDINYVAVGAGGSGGRNGNNEEYNSEGGHGGFVIEGSIGLSAGTYKAEIPGYSSGSNQASDTTNNPNQFGVDGLDCTLKNSIDTTIIYSEGGKGSVAHSGVLVDIGNGSQYNSSFTFDGVTYDRGTEGKGGYPLSDGSGTSGNDGKTITSIPGINSITLGGGGGGSAYNKSGATGGSGGAGGGGKGCNYKQIRIGSSDGVDHTGGGGGGGSSKSGASLYPKGGSGVLYIWGNFSVGTPAVYYTVTVLNSEFYLSNVEKQQVDFTTGTSYFFNQSDSSNTGEQIVFGYTPDSDAILEFTDGVTIMGTPGRPGAYTRLDLPDDFVGPLYYYSLNTTGMGYS